jgi:hypothetical protein
LPDGATATTAFRSPTIAAAAAEHGGLAVLHKDGHFDRLAEVLAFESVALPVD